MPDEDDHLPEEPLGIDQLAHRSPHGICRVATGRARRFLVDRLDKHPVRRVLGLDPDHVDVLGAQHHIHDLELGLATGSIALEGDPLVIVVELVDVHAESLPPAATGHHACHRSGVRTPVRSEVPAMVSLYTAGAGSVAFVSIGCVIGAGFGFNSKIPDSIPSAGDLGFPG